MKALASVALLIGVLVVPSSNASAKDPEGQIIDFQINAPEGAVPIGSTITWTNNGKRPHTVTDRGGMFDTDAILPGQTATVKVDVPGTYEIFCQINPSKMNATIVVGPGTVGGASPPTAVRVQAFDEARQGETQRFDPAELEVAAGTRVILANVGGLRHSLAAQDGSFTIPIVEPGAENGRFAGSNDSVVVTRPGSHAFFCEIHPATMKGTLVVTAAQVKAEDRAPPVADRPPAAASATATEFRFDATETLVAPGGTVTWRNGGTKPHTATFDDIKLDTGRIEPGASASLTAPGQPGSYSYHCAVHPDQMRGVLVVSPEPAQAAAATTPAAAATATDDDSAGTVFSWVLAVLLVGTGVVGLVLALRRRPSTT
jgi:plastocyanin